MFFIFFCITKKEKNNTLKLHFHVTIGKEITKIAMPVAITSYIRSGLSSLKQLLIPLRLEKSGLSSSQATAYYGLIQGMTIPLLLFPEVIIYSFSSLVMPEFAYYDARKEGTKITYAIERIFRITFFFSIGMIGIFLFYSEPINFLIYQNFDIAIYLKTIAPLLFFMYLDSIVDNILKGLNEQIGVMKCNILDLVVSIVCIYWLLPIWGLTGYVIVIYISELLNCGISLYQLKQKTHFKIDFINWLIKPTLGIIISYFICKLLIPTAPLTTSSIILQILLFLISYFTFLLLSHALES